MPVIPVWEPNGGGAGTDNSVIPGAGGGYTAYPQPPADNTGKFLSGMPEDYGQWGLLNYSTNFNASSVDFRIFNPGRSANQ